MVGVCAVWSKDAGKAGGEEIIEGEDDEREKTERRKAKMLETA